MKTDAILNEIKTYMSKYINNVTEKNTTTQSVKHKNTKKHFLNIKTVHPCRVVSFCGCYARCMTRHIELSR